MSYKRLTDVLAGSWEKAWADLSDEQRKAWHVCLGAVGGSNESDGNLWDARDASERKQSVDVYDGLHDPAHRAENEAWFNYYSEISKLERDIAEWEQMNHRGDPLRAQAKDKALARLRAELKRLQCNPPESSATSSIAITAPSLHENAKGSETKSTYPWVRAAQKYGRELAKEHVNLNKEQIAKKVFAAMTKAHLEGKPRMTGRGGKVPAADTIARHALGQIWATIRQQD